MCDVFYHFVKKKIEKKKKIKTTEKQSVIQTKKEKAG